MSATAPARASDEMLSLLAAMLRGEDVPWPDDPDAALAACREQGLSALVHATMRRRAAWAQWPSRVRQELDADAHADAAAELLERAELVRVLDALGSAGLAPILLKGTPLAYTVYDAPSQRSRLDTDLLVRVGQQTAARDALQALGYDAPPYSAGAELLGQFPLVRHDHLGVEHWVDVHWKISAAQLFADALTYDELAASALPVAPLGAYARAPDMPHALLLACIHPVMHHRNAVRLAWVYDIHLLAGRLDTNGWRSFTALATAKRLREVCAHGLDLARALLQTRIPSDVTAALTAGGPQEPTAAYLGAARGWLDELGADLLARRSWPARLRLLREIALPPASYMLASYGVTDAPAVRAALPMLYVHRAVRGVWRLMTGRK